MNNASGGAFWQTPLDELERQLGASSNGLNSIVGGGTFAALRREHPRFSAKVFISAQGSEPLSKSLGPDPSRRAP